MGARPLLLLAVAVGLLAGACRGPTVPRGVRAAPPGELTPAFQGMRGVLMDGARLRAAGDVAGLRALGPTLVRHGLGLLQSNMPHDLRDGDVAHYMEGRAVFGEALKEWVRAVEAGEADRTLRAFDGLLDTYWGWVDAMKGLPPERSV